MGQTVVNHEAVVNLANKMDELSHRAQDVLARYEDAVHSAQSSFAGAAGTTNISTTAEVKDAQMKIQTRFQAVNDLLRTGATTFTGHDEDNAHQIASVASSIRLQ